MKLKYNIQIQGKSDYCTVSVNQSGTVNFGPINLHPDEVKAFAEAIPTAAEEALRLQRPAAQEETPQVAPVVNS